MKYLEKGFKYVGIFILLVLFIFAFIYLRINVYYNNHLNEYEKSFIIQGNKYGFVPQGLVYSDKYDIVLQSSYSNNGEPSKLYVIDFTKGILLKSFDLLDPDGNKMYDHVGGLTVSDDKVWISSDYNIYEFNLEEIATSKDNDIKSINKKSIITRGDFCFYQDNMLWVGEYSLSFYYRVKDNNPLVMGYEVSDNIDYKKPKYVISIPKMAQGMIILPDNTFAFSRSYSYLINSDISIYKNVLKEDNNDYYDIDGNKIPYYTFNSSNMIEKIKIPPMSEGIFYKDGYFYILFENNSNKYIFAYPKIDKIIKYKYTIEG